MASHVDAFGASHMAALVKRVSAHVLVILGALLLALDVVQAGLPADQGLTVEVNDARPLATALDIIEKRYAWVITYEDPPYLYGADVEDVTLSVRRDFDLTRRVLAPRGGRFTFEYPTSPDGRPPNAPALLEKLLDQYRLSGHPGMFRVITTGNVFHVVPSESRDADGIFVPHVSLLDAKISFADGQRTALSMLDAIVKAVSRQRAARVGVGTVPLNLLMQRRVDGGATDESARTVLLRTLEATHRELSWRLLCAPGPGPDCALNVHFVEQKE